MRSHGRHRRVSNCWEPVSKASILRDQRKTYLEHFALAYLARQRKRHPSLRRIARPAVLGERRRGVQSTVVAEYLQMKSHDAESGVGTDAHRRP